MAQTMKLWTLYWAPEGRPIATVSATTASAAARKAPPPYGRYPGEIYAVQGYQTPQWLEGIRRRRREEMRRLLDG